MIFSYNSRFQQMLSHFLYFTRSSQGILAIPELSTTCFVTSFSGSCIDSVYFNRFLGPSVFSALTVFYFPKIFNAIYFSVNNSVFLEPFYCFFLDLCYLLKFSEFFLFNLLSDCTVSDYIINSRFIIFYNFLSIIRSQRLFLRLPLASAASQINIVPVIAESLSNLFESATWLERETWDMFGIFFLHNPDLRRILTDYGFKGFPLRKDFPLVGFLEIFFNFSTQNLTYTSIELVQNFRLFLHETPWVPSFTS